MISFEEFVNGQVAFDGFMTYDKIMNDPSYALSRSIFEKQYEEFLNSSNAQVIRW